MLFNSLIFAGFLPIVFGIYWMAKSSPKAQNAILLVASYVFYGYWDWRFLGLIALSSAIDYSVGLSLSNTDNQIRRRVLLSFSVFANLGMLGLFKYHNFFISSLVDIGIPAESLHLDIVLPVGISFYTFQTLSYTFDVYRDRLQTCRDPIRFFAFVSFFPQLVAGPIERASNLLPQFDRVRSFNYSSAVDGLRLFLWGLFKKVVIADNCATYVDAIFADHQVYSANTLLLGAVLFAFQIYGDFSGYSDMAIGIGRLFDISLMKNFATPYFSRDIAEFWRRWHISLSSWFRDYVYIPLGGSRVKLSMALRNVLIVFAVSGIWHGANWTFLVWGLINGLYFLPLMLSKRNRIHTDEIAPGRLLPSCSEAWGIANTFLLTCFAWVFFRAASVSEAYAYLGRMIRIDILVPRLTEAKALSVGAHLAILLLFITVMLGVEWAHRNRRHVFDLSIRSRTIRWAVYYSVLIAIVLFGGAQQDFIYFQF